MRTLIRAGLLLAGAAALSFGLSTAASADMVEPKSAYQPASVALLSEKGAAEVLPEPAEAEATKKAEPKKAAKPEEKVAATPAPEQVVRQAPAHITRPENQTAPASSVAEKIVNPFRAGLQQIGASLARVVSACDVLPGTAAGGPVFVLAVLSLAAPLIRRRVVSTRWTADEDVPEFLYAQELTPPG